jgi:hypothetical protein
MDTNRPMVIGAAVVIVAGALGVWYYLHTREAKAPAAPAAVQQSAPSDASAIAHPIPQGADDPTLRGPLPELANSDPALSGALAALAGDAAVKSYLVPENIVRRIVVTVDNLPRQKVAVEKRPVKGIPGGFLTDGDELHSTLDARNFARYEPLVSVIAKLDMQRLTAVYVHFYPLFQSVYQNLGYPNGYFNDRLVQVIDVLLATPQPTGPVDLVRPNVMYTFADPALEARPAGQKLLIRMGPQNAAAIKAKLVELRAAVTAAPLKR